MLINEQQQRIFETFGYMTLPGLFSADEMAELRAAFDSVYTQHQDTVVPLDHVVHDNKPRLVMPQIVDKHERLKALLDDPRINDIVSALVSEDWQLMGSDGNIFDCGTRWHTDLLGLSYQFKYIKCIIYFEAMKAGEDAFRVIPGSHHHTDRFAKQLKKNVKTPMEHIGVDLLEVPAIEVPVTPGDLVIFDPRLWHCVPYAGNCRHMMSFIFSEAGNVPEEPTPGEYR